MQRYQTFSVGRPMRRKQELWRYLTLEKFAWMLETSKLYHARLDLLGDPFEGAVTKPHFEREEAKAKSGDPWAAVLRPVRRQGTDRFLEYACCWHASSVESAAMWKLYASENAGVAIVSSPERLVEAVDLTPFAGTLGPVEYLDFDNDEMVIHRQAPPRPPLKAIQGFTKRKSFEHEQEVRGMIDGRGLVLQVLTKMNRLDPSELKEKMPPGVAVNIDLGVVVGAIYISPLAQSCFRQVVEMMAERCGLKERVRASTLNGEPLY